jgi:hypothetical protein
MLDTGRSNMRRSTISLVAACAVLAAVFIFQGCGDDGGTGPTNRAPEISSLTAAPDMVDPMGTSVITCTAGDADGDTLIYAWSSQSGTITGSGSEVVWNATASAGSHFIAVTVTDEKGKSASDTVYVTVGGGTLLVQDDGDLLAVDFNGNYFTLYADMNEVEVLGTRIFSGRGHMIEIDHSGNPTHLFSRPTEVPWATTTVVLPDAGFAFISNGTDSIYFVRSDGAFDLAIEVPEPSPMGLQGTRGTVVGNNLAIVDTHSSKIWQIDLTTYQASVVADLAHGNADLRDVDYDAGAYFTCNSLSVIKYVPGTRETLLATIPGANLGSICVVGRYAYVGNYRREEVYRVDINTGEYEVFLDGLTDAEDIEFVPVTLVP